MHTVYPVSTKSESPAVFNFRGDSGQVFELGDYVLFFVGSVSEKRERACGAQFSGTLTAKISR